MPHILAIDQGTTSSRAILFDRDGRDRRQPRSRSSRSIFRRTAGSSTIPKTSGTTVAAVCRDAMAAPGSERRTSPPSASPTSARRRCSWERDTGRPIHRAIVWQDRRTRARAAASRRRPSRTDRAARTGLRRSTPISPAPSSPGCSTTSPAPARRRERRARLRHRRQLPDLAADRRPRPRHRRDQRLAHAALRHRTGAGTREMLDLLDIPHEMLPEVRDCAASFGVTDPHLFGAAIPIMRHRRRPAGRDRRPGLLPARPDEGDLRHRLLRRSSTPARVPRAANRLLDHDRLPARRQARPTPSKARSSSPAPRSSGCATG